MREVKVTHIFIFSHFPNYKLCQKFHQNGHQSRKVSSHVVYPSAGSRRQDICPKQSSRPVWDYFCATLNIIYTIKYWLSHWSSINHHTIVLFPTRIYTAFNIFMHMNTSEKFREYCLMANNFACSVSVYDRVMTCILSCET